MSKACSIILKSGYSHKFGIFDAVDPDYKIPYQPEPDDLYRLHVLLRQRKVFNVLEFGIGFSTVVMADALAKNEQDYKDVKGPDVRIRKPWTVFSVDASEYWIEIFNKKYNSIFPHFNHIELSYSHVVLGEYGGGKSVTFIHICRMWLLTLFILMSQVLMPMMLKDR